MSPPVTVKDEKTLFTIIRASFSQRRKTLSNSLKLLIPDCKELQLKADIDPVRRAETLSIEDFARLANLID